MVGEGAFRKGQLERIRKQLITRFSTSIHNGLRAGIKLHFGCRIFGILWNNLIKITE